MVNIQFEPLAASDAARHREQSLYPPVHHSKITSSVTLEEPWANSRTSKYPMALPPELINYQLQLLEMASNMAQIGRTHDNHLTHLGRKWSTCGRSLDIQTQKLLQAYA